MTQHTFEQTVLAFLDGMLDHREESNFLDEVRRDPEKRMLLEQHRMLRCTLEQQRSSYLPAATERALADRIPALRNIPPLDNAALVHASAGVRSLLSVRRVAVMLISGAALVVLLGLLQQSDFMRDASISEPSGRATSSRNEDASERVYEGVDPAFDTAATRDAFTGQGQAWIQTTNEGNAGAPSLRKHSSRQQVDRGVRVATEQPVMSRVHPRDQGLNSATPQPGRQDDAALPAISKLIDDMRGGIAMREIALFPASQRAEGSVHAHIFRTERAVFGRKLQAYVESGASMREALRSGQRVGNGYSAQYLAGIRWEFDPFVAAGVEFGQSVLAREGRTMRTATMEGSPDMDVIIVENVVEEEGQTWLRAHVFYTFNPGDLIQFQTSAGSGLLLGSERNVMFAVGAAVQYPLRSNLYIRAGLHYSGTWLDASGKPLVLPEGTGNPVAIKYPAEGPGRLFNSSLQFRIGAGYLLW